MQVDTSMHSIKIKIKKHQNLFNPQQSQKQGTSVYTCDPGVCEAGREMGNPWVSMADWSNQTSEFQVLANYQVGSDRGRHPKSTSGLHLDARTHVYVYTQTSTNPVRFNSCVPMVSNHLYCVSSLVSGQVSGTAHTALPQGLCNLCFYLEC